MTALEQYIRLEATGRWRAPGAEDWREVLVSFGNATLVLSDFEDHPLTHWSLAATRRVGSSNDAVSYAPDLDGGEVLEISDTDMNDAIAAVTALARGAQPTTRRTRRWPLAFAAVLLAIAALGVAFGPDALRSRALALVPDARTDLLDQDMLRTLGDDVCNTPQGADALTVLSERLDADRPISVFNWSEAQVGRLPGGTIFLSRGLLEATITSEEVAGWIALAIGMSREDTALAGWVSEMSTGQVIKFLASADITETDIALMLEKVRTSPVTPDADAISAAADTLAAKDVAPRAFLAAARASFPGLADLTPPTVTSPVPPLDDQSWVALQEICG